MSLNNPTTLIFNDLSNFFIMVDGTVVHDHHTPWSWIGIQLWSLENVLASVHNEKIETMCTYNLFINELNKVLFIHSPLENIKGNDSLRCEFKENRKLLALNEHLATHTCLSYWTPAFLMLVCLVIDTGFIQPYTILCRNITIFCLLYTT